MIELTTKYSVLVLYDKVHATYLALPLNKVTKI